MLPQTIVCQTSQSFSKFPAVTFMFLVNFKAQSVVWCFSINFAPKYNKDNCFRFLPKFLKFKDLLYHQYPSTSDFQKLLIQFHLKDFKPQNPKTPHGNLKNLNSNILVDDHPHNSNT